MFQHPEALPLPQRTLLVIAAVWLAVAAPLTTLGYGSDVDAWLVGDRAYGIWATGSYARSRSTGFPLYEIAVTPLVHAAGWTGSNLLSLACGTALMAAFARMARGRMLRYPALSLATFIFLPVVVKNATSTIDYVPGLALCAWAYVLLHERRFLACAVLIGLACGVRPSNVVFVLPTAAAAWLDTRRATVPVRVGLVAVLVGTLAFLPSLRLGAFGLAAVTGPLNGILNGMRLLGIVQTVVFGVVVLAAAGRQRQRLADPRERPFVAFHALTLSAWLLVFAWLPGEPDYLFPCTLTAVLLLDRYATPRQFVAGALALISFHAVAIEVEGSRGGLQRPGPRIAAGLTVRDVDDRRFKLWLRSATAAPGTPGSTPVLLMEQLMPAIVGRPEWRYEPEYDVFIRDDAALRVSQRITEIDTLRALRQAGIRVVCWREREWEYLTPAQVDTRPLIEFIDDPGALLGVPMRGWPADLPRPRLRGDRPPQARFRAPAPWATGARRDPGR